MIRGGLFTRYFLEEGVREATAYPAPIAALGEAVRGHWAALAQMERPSEAETESEFIYPVLDLLGWQHLPQQEPGKGRRDVADALLFLSDTEKAKARRLRSVDRFRHGAVVVENEARDTLLDRASSSGEAPSSQILRYLGRAEAGSGGAVRWGLLTNGRFWRLYWANARARAEGFVELDLPALLGDFPPPVPEGAPADHWLRVFVLLFGRDALQPWGIGGRTFLDDALAEGRRYEQRITAALSRIVFDTVFPDLVAAVVREAPGASPADLAWLAEARDASLRLLYRLLFLFYAEDRDLLPVRNDGYAAYSLRGLREEAARIMDERRPLSPRARTWWPRLTALFAAVAEGDRSMGLPPYNGGLFEESASDLLRHLALPDSVLAPLIDAMSRVLDGDARRWINYRDLSVQHLGGIYERLLERDPVPDGSGGVSLRPNPYARKTTGSYYTPDELVQLILRRAVGPLLDERRAAFEAKAKALAADRRPKPARLAELARLDLDPAEAFVALRVCDPAMGAGHFLVSLVDYLADEVLTAITGASVMVGWGEYRSPLARRIEELRAHIRAEGAAHGWPVREDQLDDRHIVRRIILKRVIYGVDLNPMAVELAKLSLWLHSFTVGAPLSFLDHHLRVGDSLFGEFVYPVEDDLRARFGLAMSQAVVRARQSASGMAMIEALTDADIGEVHSSAEAFHGVEQATAELRGFLDLYHTARWLPIADKAEKIGRESFFGGSYGDTAAIASLQTRPKAPPADPAVDDKLRRSGKVPPIDAFRAFERWLDQARVLVAERRFLHWEAAFPGVWDEWERASPPGGFDAVIGNPPWDRIKVQEVEWFAARVPAVAKAQRASDRKRMIEGLRRAGGPVAAAYDDAAATAEAAASVAAGISPFADRKEQREMPSRDYPLLSGGDANLYALFVERAGRIVQPQGIVGLLVPSGIAADKGAADFFRRISTTGRLAALLDFENGARKPEAFFPDVHRSFKFCALVYGGLRRSFAHSDCAFFQKDALAAEAAAFPLTPDDFSVVNPNTGTAPVFRTRRDAAITRGIYQRLPVLVDRREPEPHAVWPVHYVRMFDMTNDSGKFRTEQELVSAGAYRVAGNRWEKGGARWLPLMVGRSFHIFDHRAASVAENQANLHNPFLSELTTPEQHTDPDFSPRPQFWVSETEIEWPAGLDWALAFRDIARPTDARTVIAALVSKAGYGNTAPLLLPDALSGSFDAKGAGWQNTLGDGQLTFKDFAPLLAGNLCSVVLDYVARQKVQSTHLNFYIVEQLPLVPAPGFARRFGSKTAGQIIREDMLRLTYTANDMAGFARDQGYAGPPFEWDEKDRLRRRARLDAVFFHLYGLDRDAAEYVLGTFPIVKREEEARYHGRYRSRDLILGYMAALAAGELDAPVAG